MGFSRSKFKALSTLCANICEVSLASLVFPAFIGIDKVDWVVLVLGMMAFVVTGYLSLVLAEKGKL